MSAYPAYRQSERRNIIV